MAFDSSGESFTTEDFCNACCDFYRSLCARFKATGFEYGACVYRGDDCGILLGGINGFGFVPAFKSGRIHYSFVSAYSIFASALGSFALRCFLGFTLPQDAEEICDFHFDFEYCLRLREYDGVEFFGAAST